MGDDEAPAHGTSGRWAERREPIATAEPWRGSSAAREDRRERRRRRAEWMPVAGPWIVGLVSGAVGLVLTPVAAFAVLAMHLVVHRDRFVGSYDYAETLPFALLGAVLWVGMFVLLGAALWRVFRRHWRWPWAGVVVAGYLLPPLLVLGIGVLDPDNVVLF
ncbi:hypothetical protein QE364_003123 [Nocardioides zeae]|uniref:Uncharacterized protein n=1 Tax=Nocardioides zeae TaxID=1457234 RepID=A0ACC6IL21_9ACTN|nr:hypothetical protein [Nocardioides zeae]MDR6174046.1 hypothetical protein [Nocardioides zeae]MDR6211399.1 hypothetical protein [Nocardioides zeae]